MGKEVVFTDDLDRAKGTRTVIDWDGAGKPPTYEFSIDGKDYEIDLSSPNAARLQTALAPYIEAARKMGRGNVVAIGAGRASTPSALTAEDKERNQAIREWARAHHFKVSERGRIPTTLVEAYDNRDMVTDAPAANETAERETEAPKTAIEKLIPVTHAPDRETYKAGLAAWAQNKGLKLNSRTGHPAPPFMKQYNEETGIYPPEKVANTG